MTPKPCILIVDDMPANLEVLGHVLSVDHQVVVATGGQKALDLAQHRADIELILLDVTMPQMDGFEVCRRLKADAKTRAIPVIFVTARDENADEEMGFAVGGVDYVTKPFSPPLVLARVRTHLALFNQQRWLEERVRERTREVIQTRDVAIHGLSSLAETRDNETGDHIKRTQYYVRTLALALRENPAYREALTDEAIDLLYKSAPLHDVGKVGIRDHILLKPGKLTPEEFAIMQTHTIIGRDAISRGEEAIGLVQGSSFLAFAREIAWTHHEKWDGSGYPRGLVGDAIPLSGRIMAIADVYDALISRRVYKPPFPHESAVQMMAAERGRHFDPVLFDLFISLERECLRIAFEHTHHEEERASLGRSLGIAEFAGVKT